MTPSTRQPYPDGLPEGAPGSIVVNLQPTTWPQTRSLTQLAALVQEDEEVATKGVHAETILRLAEVDKLVAEETPLPRAEA